MLMGLMRKVTEEDKSKMIPMFFAQEIRGTEILFTEMRKSAGGTSWEGGEGLESVIWKVFGLRCLVYIPK